MKHACRFLSISMLLATFVLPVAAEESLLKKLEREIAALAEEVRPSLVQVQITREYAPLLKLHVPEVSLEVESDTKALKRSFTIRDTGVVIDAEGHVLVGRVVSPEDEIKILFQDGRTEPASLKGTDPRTEISLLKLNDAPTTHLPLAEGENPSPGSLIFLFAVSDENASRFVLTTGGAHGYLKAEEIFEINAPAGTVPGKAVAIDTDGAIAGIITPASVVIEGLRGEVLPPPGTSEGKRSIVNLQIPFAGTEFRLSGDPFRPEGKRTYAYTAAEISEIVQAIKTTGKCERKWLGIGISEIDMQKDEQFPQKVGITIEEVIKDAPSERAGLKAGDIIVELNGKTVEGIASFARQIRSADREVTLKLLRGKEILIFEMKPEPRPQGLD